MTESAQTDYRGGICLVMIRHGEQDHSGRDRPLTARGRLQVDAAARAIALTAADVLISSSRPCARQTAELLGSAAEAIDDLDEYRRGASWTLERADARQDLVVWRADHRCGDESLAEFQTRVERALDGLVKRAPPGRVVMCVHGGVIDAILRWAFGITPDMDWITETTAPHASITELLHWPTGRRGEGTPRHTVLVRVGDVRHLSADLISEW